jgi:hypothetical protein
VKDAILQEAMGLMRAQADRSFRDSCAFHGACVGEVWVARKGCMGNKWDCLLFDLEGSAITVKRASDRATREGYVCVVVCHYCRDYVVTTS